jgi:hypothetical protein
MNNSLKKLAEANREYSMFMKGHTRAMDVFFQKNALGNYVPNINKALGAVTKGDLVALREMKLADMPLPKEDKLLPQIESLVKEADAIGIQQKAIMKNIKQKVKMEQRELAEASRKSINNLQRNQRLLKMEERELVNKEIHDYMNIKDNEYREVLHRLREEQNFFVDQEAIRGIGA